MQTYLTGIVAKSLLQSEVLFSRQLGLPVGLSGSRQSLFHSNVKKDSRHQPQTKQEISQANQKVKPKKVNSFLSYVNTKTAADTMSTPTAPKNFYRRVLPDTCIAFVSDEGKQVFKEALIQGHMEGYFGLAAQFRTQDEPAYCGLSTLVMVLNTLQVDPKKVWKGVWRWYHENMLDCCVPLGVVAQKGITFDQFACLAACNALTVKVVRATPDASEEDFRKQVKLLTRSSEQVIVASYSRKQLGQTGDGHFSPIAGYHPERDLVLILDTARFKYPPHWVPLSMLHAAMQSHDQDTGLPRGYFILGKSQQYPLVLFRLAAHLSPADSETMQKFLESWKGWLDAIPVSSLLSEAAIPTVTPFEFGVVTHEAIVQFLTALQHLEHDKDEHLLSTQLDITCPEQLSTEHSCAVNALLADIEKLEIYSQVKEVLSKANVEAAVNGVSSKNVLTAAGVPCSGPRACSKLSAGGVKTPCNIDLTVDSAHFVTMLVLSWPYGKCGQSNCQKMARAVVNDMVNGSQVLQNEVAQLRQQLQLVLNYNEKCGNCQCG